MLLSYFSTKSRNCKYTGRGASRIKRQFCDCGFHSNKIGIAALTAATIRNGLCISAYFLISIKLRTFGCQKYNFRYCIIIIFLKHNNNAPQIRNAIFDWDDQLLLSLRLVCWLTSKAFTNINTQIWKGWNFFISYKRKITGVECARMILPVYIWKLRLPL